MTTGVTFPNVLDGLFEELRLGKRGTSQTIVPDGDECDHIATLLRRGVRSGLGFVMWDLRTAPGVRIGQDALDEIARCVLEAQFEGCVGTIDPDGRPGIDARWRIAVRR